MNEDGEGTEEAGMDEEVSDVAVDVIEEPIRLLVELEKLSIEEAELSLNVHVCE